MLANRDCGLVTVGSSDCGLECAFFPCLVDTTRNGRVPHALEPACRKCRLVGKIGLFFPAAEPDEGPILPGSTRPLFVGTAAKPGTDLGTRY